MDNEVSAKKSVRLTASVNDRSRYETIRWMQENKSDSIEILSKIMAHEILPGSATEEERRAARKGAALYLRYLADSIEIETSKQQDTSRGKTAIDAQEPAYLPAVYPKDVQEEGEEEADDDNDDLEEAEDDFD